MAGMHVARALGGSRGHVLKFWTVSPAEVLAVRRVTRGRPSGSRQLSTKRTNLERGCAFAANFNLLRGVFGVPPTRPRLLLGALASPDSPIYYGGLRPPAPSPPEKYLDDP